MENKQMDVSTSSHRLRPPFRPYSPTTTAVPHANNSHHLHHSFRRPFQREPAAATAHFSSQSGPGFQDHQLPMSPLPRTNHASAGGAGTGASVDNTISLDATTGSGWESAAGSSSYHQRPPSQGALPGSSRYQVQPRSWPASVAALGAGLQESPPLSLLAQSSTSIDLGFTTKEDEYNLPPLPPSLGGPPSVQTATAVVGLEAVRPAGPVYISLGDSDDDSGNNSVGHYDGLQSSPAAAWVKKGSVDWSSRGTSQLGINTIAGSGSSSMMSMPQAYSSGNTGLVPGPAAGTNFGVKSTIASGGSSSLLSRPQPAYSSVKTGPTMVAGNKRKLPSSPVMGWGSGGAPGSSILYKDDANSNAPVVPDFADGLFTQRDINKIMEDKGLQDMVLTDPKMVRRILRNRRNAHKSMKKKAAYLSDLENKFELLQQQKKSLSARLNSLESAALLLKAENSEIVIKLNGFEQQIQQLNATNENLNAEVYRLKLASGEIRGSHVSKSSYQEMSHQMMQQDNLQIHEHQLAQLQQELEEPVDLDSFFT